MERRAVCDHCGASFSILGDTDLADCPKCGWIVKADACQKRTSSGRHSAETPGPALTPESYHPRAPQDRYEPGAGALVFGWVLFGVVIISPFIGGEAGGGLSGLGYLASIVLVAVDASRIHLKELKYSTLPLSLHERTGPVAWTVICWLLWMPGYLVYLANRQKLARAAYQTIQEELYRPLEERRGFIKGLRKKEPLYGLLPLLLYLGVQTAFGFVFLFLLSLAQAGHSQDASGGLLTGFAGIGHYNDGVGYLNQGNMDAAESEFKQAVEQNPNLAEAHLNLGLIAMQNGWLDGAEKRTRTCIDILERTRTTIVEGVDWRQPLSIAYNNMGCIEMSRAQITESERGYGSGRGQWQSGIGYFRKAIELDASNSKARGNIERFKGAY